MQQAFRLATCLSTFEDGRLSRESNFSAVFILMRPVVVCTFEGQRLLGLLPVLLTSNTGPPILGTLNRAPLAGPRAEDVEAFPPVRELLLNGI